MAHALGCWRLYGDSRLGSGPQGGFFPSRRALVKAVACELVAETKQPLSRQSWPTSPHVPATRWAHRSVAAPCGGFSMRMPSHRGGTSTGSFRAIPSSPRRPARSGPLCGHVAGQPLGPKDHILSADEKTSIQARIRCHPSLPPVPGRPAYIENEYKRGGALQYLAAWDVRRGT